MVSHLVKILSVLSWNVQGMGDPDKCVLVRNSVLSMDPCLACLQETKLSHLNGIKRPAFLPPRLSDFATKDADGSHGGVVTAWDPRLLCLQPHWILCSHSPTFTCLLTTPSPVFSSTTCLCLRVPSPGPDFNLLHSPMEKITPASTFAARLPLTRS